MQFSSPFDPNVLLSTLFSKIISLYYALNMGDHVSHPYKTIGRMVVLTILIITALEIDGKTNDSEEKSSKHFPNLISP
jgi:hypothetical protein